MQSIPASAIVQVLPNVIGAGGSALDLNGLVLTRGTRVPIGSVLSFPSATAVTDYFGAGSIEGDIAAVYFLAVNNSYAKPGALLFAQYPTAPVGAFIRGGNVSALTVPALQALTGTLTVTVDGVVKTSSAIALSTATSLSNAAVIITAAFTSPAFTLIYDSVSGGFLLSGTSVGATAILSEVTGTLATALGLTAATGAVQSQGAIAATPAAFMGNIVAQTSNWASFMTAFDPDLTGNANKRLFASWNNLRQNRYLYVCWDTDITPTLSMQAPTSLGSLIKADSSSGTFMLYAPNATQGILKAAFEISNPACLDFGRTNGRSTAAFRSQTGLVADITSQTVGENLTANGYNYYGAYATANDQFVFMYRGTVSGPFMWLDSYVDQIWMNNGLQLALMTLLTQMKSIPYNAMGYALIEAACLDPINAALNFGAIRRGVPLSPLQMADINNAAGIAVDDILSTRGWYLQVKPASAIVRAARGSPPISLWYTDGGSVQRITLASTEVQ
jgi:hypothetical protein